MIPKIPVPAFGEFYVGAHRDEATAGLQTAKHLIECLAQRSFVREVLEKVTRKDEIEFAIGQRPLGRTILLDEFNSGIKIRSGVWIQIHSELGIRAHCIDELAVAASQV